MRKAFDAASRAHESGDGARAKQLSNEGHAHQVKRDQLNDEAADWIYNANNADKGPGEIDLHGLYVQEAIERTEKAVQVNFMIQIISVKCDLMTGCYNRRHSVKGCRH